MSSLLRTVHFNESGTSMIRCLSHIDKANINGEECIVGSLQVSGDGIWLHKYKATGPAPAA